MSVRKHGNGWQVRYPGFKAVSVPRKVDALRLEADMKTRKSLGHLHQESPTLFGAELDQLVVRKKSVGGRGGKLRPKTIKFYEDSVKPWAPLRDVPVNELRRRHVEDHVVARARLAPVSAGNELRVAKQALRVAKSRGQLVDEAIFAIDAISHQPEEGRALTLDELNGLSAVFVDRLRVLPLFVGIVGLRFTEAMNLDDSMVDLPGAQIEIPARLNKSRKRKPIPLAAYEVALLREQLELRPPSERGLFFPTRTGNVYTHSGFRGGHWAPALRQVGLEGFRFHWLRHTAISRMAAAGMQSEMIALRVGHSDGGALIYKRYRHLFASEVTKAVSLIDVLMTAASATADGLRMDTANA